MELVLDTCIMKAAGQGVKTCRDVVMRIDENCDNRLVVDKEQKLVEIYNREADNVGIASTLFSLIRRWKVDPVSRSQVRAANLTSSEKLILEVARSRGNCAIVTNRLNYRRFMRFKQRNLVPNTVRVTTPTGIMASL